jgi:hypothetical protein
MSLTTVYFANGIAMAFGGEQLFNDVLWNDPHEGHGIRASNRWVLQVMRMVNQFVRE